MSAVQGVLEGSGPDCITLQIVLWKMGIDFDGTPYNWQPDPGNQFPQFTETDYNAGHWGELFRTQPSYADVVTATPDVRTWLVTNYPNEAPVQAYLANINKVDKVTGKGLSTNDFDATAKGKVDALGSASTHAATDFATPASVASAVAALVNSAPGTLDTLGEIAAALAADESAAAALATTVGNKVDKSGTKVLSDNNYTTTEQTKLAGIDAGATVNSTFYYKGTLKTNVLPLTVVGTVGASGSVTFDLTKTNVGSGGVAAFSEVYPETSNLTNVNGIPFQPSAWTVAGDLKSITMTLKQPGTVGILGGALSYVNVGSGTTVNLTIFGKAA